MVRDLHYRAWNNHIYLMSLGQVRVIFYGKKKRFRRIFLNHSGMRGSLRGGHFIDVKNNSIIETIP